MSKDPAQTDSAADGTGGSDWIGEERRRQADRRNRSRRLDERRKAGIGEVMSDRREREERGRRGSDRRERDTRRRS